MIVPFQLRVRKNAKPDEIQGLAYIFVKMLAGPQVCAVASLQLDRRSGLHCEDCGEVTRSAAVAEPRIDVKANAADKRGAEWLWFLCGKPDGVDAFPILQKECVIDWTM